ncbi:MAG TPA: DUF2064 domain-containing protein [Xanthomonadaceae bacterium]|nr:DUF2064 domain-containing protein [Xanthomonadaceae bacterium]
MSCALAIWVKTPGLSPVKTRLAARLGADAALAIYEACVDASAAVARAAAAIEPSLMPYWAVAEESALDAPRWRDFARIAQGEGGLGERLARVYAGLRQRHAGVLFIGADAPQCGAAALVAAARSLRDGEADFLLGPAADGGFWLFGGRKPLPDAAWTGVTYSRGDTASALAAQLEGHGFLAWLPTLRDLDQAGDIVALAAALRALPAPLPEQQRLLALLDVTHP